MEVYTETFVYQALLSTPDIDKIREMHPDDFVLESVYDWCDETFGNTMWYNTYYEIGEQEVFAFKQEEHRNWFVLRWS
jgi:hypothetical protein